MYLTYIPVQGEYRFAMRFILYMLLASAMSISCCLADDDDELHKPDAEDFRIIESCIAANRHPELYGRYQCIGLVFSRCLSLSLPMQHYWCDEREDTVWTSLKARYFRLLYDRETNTEETRRLLLSYDKHLHDRADDDCAYEIEREEEGSIGQSYASFRCYRNEHAEQALKYIWLTGI